MIRRWQDAKTVAAGYAGTQRGAAAIGPAVTSLRHRLPGARLLLLAPARLTQRAPIAACFDARIDYPAEADAAGLRKAVGALAAEGADAAVVFTETGWSAYVPAYIAYLAGVPLRGGITAEFGGAVLTHAVPPPTTNDTEERHLLLLEAVGIIDRRTIAGHAGERLPAPQPTRS